MENLNKHVDEGSTPRKDKGVSRRRLLSAFVVGSLAVLPFGIRWWWQPRAQTVTFLPPFQYGGFRSDDLGRKDIDNIGGFARVELFRVRKSGRYESVGVRLEFLGQIDEKMGIDATLTTYTNDGKIAGSKRHFFNDPRLTAGVSRSISGISAYSEPFCWLGCNLDQSYSVQDLARVDLLLVRSRVVFSGGDVHG